MNEIIPRHEFRIFSPVKEEAGLAILENAEDVQYRESREVYLVSSKTDRFNTKIRNNILDVKKLLSVDPPLEQWKPVLKIDLPVEGRQLERDLFTMLDVRYPVEPDLKFNGDELIATMRDYPEIFPVEVVKKRNTFLFKGCMAEVSEVIANGAFLHTVCLESEEKQSVMEAVKALGFTERENVSYLKAFGRLTGIQPMDQ